MLAFTRLAFWQTSSTVKFTNEPLTIKDILPDHNEWYKTYDDREMNPVITHLAIDRHNNEDVCNIHHKLNSKKSVEMVMEVTENVSCQIVTSL